LHVPVFPYRGRKNVGEKEKMVGIEREKMVGIEGERI